MNHARRADVFQTRAEESFTHANTSEPLTSGDPGAVAVFRMRMGGGGGGG